MRRDDELIRAVRIPLPLAEVTAFHKITKRRFDDISSVAIAFALDIRDGIVTGARIGLGGVAATPIRAYDTERRLVGEAWNIATVRAAAAVLGAEGTPMSDHRASAEYRALMLEPRAAEALQRQHPRLDRDRREAIGMSDLAARPVDPVVGIASSRTRARRCTSTGAARCTPTTWPPRPPACSPHGRCSRRTPTRGSRSTSRAPTACRASSAC